MRVGSVSRRASSGVLVGARRGSLWSFRDLAAGGLLELCVCLRVSRAAVCPPGRGSPPAWLSGVSPHWSNGVRRYVAYDDEGCPHFIG